MLSSVTAELFGIEPSFLLTVAISGLCVVIFGMSVYLGLDKGIKRLSDFNMGLAGIFLLWVLIFGPTMYALELGTSSLGLMFQELIRITTWTDPIQETGFVEDVCYQNFERTINKVHDIRNVGIWVVRRGGVLHNLG